MVLLVPGETSGTSNESACFQQWNAEGGNPSALFYRVTDGYLIRFPDIADFHVSVHGDHIQCLPVADTDERWQPVYEQQVLPLLHSLTGDPVYHGAGVVVNGVAIAFLGSSGRGKSTLAAAFATRGHAFLGDDCLQLVDAVDGQVHVRPHADHIRLWDDSLEAFASPTLSASWMPGSPKPHLMAADDLRHCDEPLPLARVYVLGDGSATMPTVTSLTAAEMLLAWTRNAFVLDIKSPVVLRRSFDAASKLARSIPARQLDYPRRYDALDDVVACVLADLQLPVAKS